MVGVRVATLIAYFPLEQVSGLSPKRGKMLNFPQKGLAQSPPSTSKIDISASSSGRAEYDEAHRNWKYKLFGHDIEGDELVLVVAVDTDEQRITIITKF